MPIDEYVVAGPEEQQTGDARELHSRFGYTWDVVKALRGWTTIGDIYLRIADQQRISVLPSDAVMSQTLYNLSPTIGISSWATTGQELWQSIGRASNVGDVSRFLVADEPLVFTGFTQVAPLWGGVQYWGDDDTVAPLLEPITSHD